MNVELKTNGQTSAHVKSGCKPYAKSNVSGASSRYLTRYAWLAFRHEIMIVPQLGFFGSFSGNKNARRREAPAMVAAAFYLS